PVVRVEVERIDVLVLLRRVLRVLDRPVGSPAEPARVLANPRVVRRGLERDVERDPQPVLPRLANEPYEVVQRTEGRVNRGVASLGRADRPGASRVAFAGPEGVVRAFPKTGSDGVDRGEIQDVEAHRRDVWEPGRGGSKGAVRAALARRPREELVPGREACVRGLDHHADRRGARGVSAIGIALSKLEE